MAASIAKLVVDAPIFPEYKVKMSMYKQNLASLIARFEKVAKSGLIMLEGGQVTQRLIFMNIYANLIFLLDQRALRYRY